MLVQEGWRGKKRKVRGMDKREGGEMGREAQLRGRRELWGGRREAIQCNPGNKDLINMHFISI